MIIPNNYYGTKGDLQLVKSTDAEPQVWKAYGKVICRFSSAHALRALTPASFKALYTYILKAEFYL